MASSMPAGVETDLSWTVTGRIPLPADGRSCIMSTNDNSQKSGNAAGLIVVGGVLVLVAAATAIVLFV